MKIGVHVVCEKKGLAQVWKPIVRECYISLPFLKFNIIDLVTKGWITLDITCSSSKVFTFVRDRILGWMDLWPE